MHITRKNSENYRLISGIFHFLILCLVQLIDIRDFFSDIYGPTHQQVTSYGTRLENRRKACF